MQTQKNGKAPETVNSQDPAENFRQLFIKFVEAYRPDEINDTLLKLLSMASESDTFETLTKEERSNMFYMIQLLSGMLFRCEQGQNHSRAQA